jgi:hypothetical protein
VLSEHIKWAVSAAKVAAVHHGGGRFRLVATASNPIASIDPQSTNRTF